MEAVLDQPASEPELEVAAEEGSTAGAGEIRSWRRLAGAAGVDELAGGVIGEREGIDEAIEGIFGRELAESGVIGPGFEDGFDAVRGDGVLFEPVFEPGANGGGREAGEGDGGGGLWGGLRRIIGGRVLGGVLRGSEGEAGEADECEAGTCEARAGMDEAEAAGGFGAG